MLPKINIKYMEMVTERNTHLEQIANMLGRAGIWNEELENISNDNSITDDDFRFKGGEL